MEERQRVTVSEAKIPDQSPFPIVRIGRDGTLLYANRPSSVLLTHWNIDVGQRVPDDWSRLIAETLDSADTREVEKEFSFKTILMELVPVPAEGIVDVFCRDITHLKQLERKLAINVQVFENAREGIMITDPEYRIIDVNRAFCAITGYSREEILGKSAKILQSGRHDAQFYRSLWETVEREGGWQGEVWDRRKTGDLFPNWLSISAVTDAAGKTVRYIGLLVDITPIKETEERLYRMANFDGLTGLANRQFFQGQLEHDVQEARRSGEQIAVMFIDLDGFKAINDNLGHAAGDQILRTISDRVRECVRDSDTVARMGGDEFIVSLSRLNGPQNAALVAQKILTHVAQPFMVEKSEVFVSASIGIALFPDDAPDMEGLVQNADTALYRAKEQGKNGCQFFSRALNAAAAERLSLRTRLRTGMEEGEIVVAWQPQIGASDGRLIGLEALARWETEDRGEISPDRFIPLAEESGLIHEIGEQILRSACAQGRRWREEGFAPVRIAVNISSRQLRRADFVPRVVAVLAEVGFPAQWLEFELTERLLIEDAPEVRDVLQRIRALGISLVIDDFGIRCSSIADLKRFSITRLKIDKDFVVGLPGDAHSLEIVTAITALGRALNLEVTAEGVQSEEQASLLRSMGCSGFQGYYFSRPLSSGSVRRFFEQS